MRAQDLHLISSLFKSNCKTRDLSPLIERVLVGVTVLLASIEYSSFFAVGCHVQTMLKSIMFLWNILICLGMQKINPCQTGLHYIPNSEPSIHV